MTNHDIEMPAGWQGAWLDRSLPFMRYYAIIVLLMLGTFVAVLGLLVTFASQYKNKKSTSKSAILAESSGRQKPRLLHYARRIYHVSIMFVAQLLIICTVDAVICFQVIFNDLKTTPEAYDMEELLLASLLIPGSIIANFAIKKIIRSTHGITIRYLLTRLVRNHGERALAHHISTAQFFSTVSAYIWSILGFTLTVVMSPMANPILRYFALTICLRSTSSWWNVSAALDYCESEIRLREIIAQTSATLTETLALFHRSSLTIRPLEGTKPHYFDNEKLEESEIWQFEGDHNV